MPVGTVKFFNDAKGFGFIQPDDGGTDAFVHITSLERSGLRSLQQEQRVSYDLEEDRRGKMQAVNLKLDDQTAPNAQ
ncbi:cold-shock protein [Sphingomonas sp. NSE70-1]|uniref:Cold-shock protein n=1 Tax=Sphingomonas caseinilyticus TaxID=2908205 RepID=A0ABT0RQZ7_9SPHN|nr:cold-shock protein [Sphingomonas caseinilyticus]MCL6697443.1 cold-shock protein [Sphingomonas caseinilyticus]